MKKGRYQKLIPHPRNYPHRGKCKKMAPKCDIGVKNKFPSTSLGLSRRGGDFLNLSMCQVLGFQQKSKMPLAGVVHLFFTVSQLNMLPFFYLRHRWSNRLKATFMTSQKGFIFSEPALYVWRLYSCRQSMIATCCPHNNHNIMDLLSSAMFIPGFIWQLLLAMPLCMNNLLLINNWAVLLQLPAEAL